MSKHIKNITDYMYYQEKMPKLKLSSYSVKDNVYLNGRYDRVRFVSLKYGDNKKSGFNERDCVTLPLWAWRCITSRGKRAYFSKQGLMRHSFLITPEPALSCNPSPTAYGRKNCGLVINDLEKI